MIATHSGGTKEISVSIKGILASNRVVKVIMAICGVALAVAVLCLLATALRLPSAGSWPPAETLWPWNPGSNPAAIPLVRTNLLAPLSASGWQPQFEAQNMQQPTRLQPSVSLGQLPAGVYKTLPYTCIVVVPGAHPDDRCIVSLPGGECPMPIIRPEVQFIPLHPANK
jgi:hypothetical protein